MADSSKMRNGLVKRGDTWSYVIRVPDPATGKTKPKWVGGFPNQRAAKEARDAARHQVHRGQYAEPSKLTVGDWLQQWLNTRTNQRPNTLSSYSDLVRLHVMPYPIAHVRLQALTPTMLSEHWRKVSTSGSRAGGPLSPRTVRYAHSIVRKAVNDAVGEHLQAPPMWSKVQLPRQAAAGSEPEAWGPDDLRAFLAATSGTRLWPLWVLMSHTGIRRGEALALRWEDVDVESGDVRVARGVSDVGKGPTYDLPKNSEARTVHAPQLVRSALREWRKAQAEDQLRAGVAWVGSQPESGALVFTMPDGRPVAPSYASKAFARAVKDSGAPALTLHGLRHTAATLLLRDGASVHLVARMLGHKDPSITLQVYSHAIPGDSNALADQLERIIGAAC
ncbi:MULTISPECIES: tyrosine-type recombinase/integrase [Nocardioides]|uniref:Tyrosine-type recombinase/integrase n=1 Tax=Nocardioides vastitatis TaxID=2568655 RepID=A0ABW0ZMV8_9ACTN|nr:tyrosine-type recombinase/integrase [Nocardioides sp.]THJ13718.1 site-specific integrase [Nocardioides sp.]